MVQWEEIYAHCPYTHVPDPPVWSLPVPWA